MGARQLRYGVGVESKPVVWDKPTRRVQPRRRASRGRPRRPYYRGQPTALRALALALPAKTWRTLTWRQGSQGPQGGRFAACRVQPAHGQVQDRAELEPVWLLLEWPPEAEAPTKYWFSNRPEEVSRRRWGRRAKRRWRVEQN